jgi:hypothetical protein
MAQRRVTLELLEGYSKPGKLSLVDGVGLGTTILSVASKGEEKVNIRVTEKESLEQQHTC